MLGFPEPDAPPVPVRADPYPELAAQTGGGWQSKVAVHAHWRGRGVAGRLLEAAEERRSEAAERRLFLIAPDSFSEALQLYRKHGFRERDRRPMVMPRGALDLGARDWVLMIKE